MSSYNNKLYAGLYGGSAGDAEVWEYSAGAWTKVGGDAVNSSWADSTFERTDGLNVYNGSLYVGLGSTAGDAEVWSYNGSAWAKIGGDAVNSSWADSTFEQVRGITTYNGKLMAALGSSAGDGEIWEYNGSTWSQFAGDATGSSWSTDYEDVLAMTSHNGKFYAGLGVSTGDAEVWEFDGNTWTNFARNSSGLSIGDYLFMGADNRIGINKNNPEATLDVVGDVQINNGLLTVKQGGVGIGDVAPTEKLTLADGANILQNAGYFTGAYGGFGKFENQVSRSEEFDHSDWTTSDTDVTVTADQAVAPDGSTTADKIADNATGGTTLTSSTITASNSETWTFSVWLKNNDATGTYKITLTDNQSTTSSTTITAIDNTSWKRYSVSLTTAAASVTSITATIDVNQGDSTRSIYAWGAQVEKASTPSVYAKTTSGTLTSAGNRGQIVNTNLTAAAGFLYGSRNITSIDGASVASSSQIGQFIRVNDNATGTNNHTVRGLEVQAYSGTQTSGINTGIATFGKTFGLHAETTSEANGQLVPAAVYADLNNGAAPTSGNAIRAYSDNATSADLLYIYQETTAYTGNALLMDIGNGGGSFNSGTFINLKSAGTRKMHVDFDGSTFVSLTGSTATDRLCWDGSGGTDEEIVDCTGTPGDLAENFGTNDPTIVAADVVVSTGEAFALTKDGAKTSKAFIKKSSTPYQANILGVVSTQPNEVYADDLFNNSENPRPVALVGRVPVKVTSENGLVQTGDYLTSSSVAGHAMKATRPGMVLGQALSSDNGSGVVIVFVSPFFHDPTILVDATGNVQLQRNTATTTLTASTETGAAQVIDQQGSGDILQLQSAGENKFFVQNSGQVNIHTGMFGSTDKLFVLTASDDTEIFNIDARGVATIKGLLVVKDDSYAGSIATLEDGTAEITFTYDLGTGKPVIQLTPEGETPVFAQVVEWKTDDQDRYTGFVMKTFGFDSQPVSAVVHYLVTGKQEGYVTYGEIEVQNPVSQPLVVPASDPVTDGGDPIVDEGSNSAPEEEPPTVIQDTSEDPVVNNDPEPEPTPDSGEQVSDSGSEETATP